MRSEDALKIGFRKLASVSRIKDITIMDICREANVSRRTFYTVFNGKDSLVESILEDDLVRPVHVLNDLFGTRKLDKTPLLLSERIYINLYENKNFYLSLISDVAMRQFFVEQVTQKYQSLMKGLFIHADISDEAQDWLLYLLSSSQVMLLLRWINEGMVVSPENMAQYNARWLLPIMTAENVGPSM